MTCGDILTQTEQRQCLESKWALLEPYGCPCCGKSFIWIYSERDSKLLYICWSAVRANLVCRQHICAVLEVGEE